MNEDTVVDNIFCSDSEDDWNESDEEDTFAHDEHSVVLDPLAREQEGKMADNGLARVIYQAIIDGLYDEDRSEDHEETEDCSEDDGPGMDQEDAAVGEVDLVSRDMGSLGPDYPYSGSPSESPVRCGTPIHSSYPRSRSSSLSDPSSPCAMDHSPIASSSINLPGRGRGRGRGDRHLILHLIGVLEEVERWV